MKPSEVSNILRKIAAKIDNSENPKRTLVAKDLRRIIIAIKVKPDLIKLALEKCFNVLKQTEPTGEVIGIGEGVPFFDRLLNNYEFGATLGFNEDELDNDVFKVDLTIQCHDNVDTIYSALVDEFNVDTAADLLINAINESVAWFKETFK